MASPNQPLIIELMNSFKADLLSSEQVAINRMIDAWALVEDSVSDQLELVANDLQNRQREGLPVTEYHIQRMDRYQSLLNQTQAELDKYVDDIAQPITQTRQQQLANAAIQDSDAALRAINVSGSFDKLPVEAIQNLVGISGDGYPLVATLQNSYGYGYQGILNELTRGVALGYNPRKMAQLAVRNGLSQSLNHMLNVMRTETLRVYRESSRQYYSNSGVVSGYRRLSARDTRVCPACLMSDGQFYRVNEIMPEHPQGRCTMIPVVDRVANVDWEIGQDWFIRQSPTVQADILGKGKYEAWKDNRFDLDELIIVTPNQTWGPTIKPANLSDLVRN